MDAYTFLKFIHVFLAITAVGGNITYGDAVLRPPELDDAVDSDVTCRLRRHDGLWPVRYTPLLRRQIETLESSGADSAAYAAVAGRARLVGILFALPITFIVVVEGAGRS